MTIRPATAANVPAIVPMVDQLAAMHERFDPARYDYKPNIGPLYLRWLAARAIDPQSILLVAERNHTGGSTPALVGFLVGTIETPIPIYRVEKFGYIHDLWVEEPYRHEGIARQMTMLAIETFRDMGVTQIRLETATANDAARGLFTSCGFRPSTVEMLLEIR